MMKTKDEIRKNKLWNWTTTILVLSVLILMLAIKHVKP